MNFIFGTAGFAKEVDWLICDLLAVQRIQYATDYFVAEDGNKLIGNDINFHLVLSEKEYFEKYSSTENKCFIAVGNPALRERIVQKIRFKSFPYEFPNLIHPSVAFDSRPGKIDIGEGNIICANSVLTTDIRIGDFVQINLDCTIGHDATLGDYATLSPGVHVSGNVHIREKVFVGTGAVLLERVTIGSNVKIGAGATVIGDLDNPGTYVGVLARKVN